MDKRQIQNAIYHFLAKGKKIEGTSRREVCDKTLSAYAGDSVVSFSDNLFFKKVNCHGKPRLLMQYKNGVCPELVISHLLSREIKNHFHLAEPNRFSITHELMNIISCLPQMMDFTIVRFDFKNFYPSLSCKYIWEKCFSNYEHLELIEGWRLLKQYCEEAKVLYPGLPLSNTLAEVIAQQFDMAIQQLFREYEIMLYERYIDDGIIVIRHTVDPSIARRLIKKACDKVFHDHKAASGKSKAHVSFSPAANKFSVISLKGLVDTKGIWSSFTFLGYSYRLRASSAENIEYEFGVEDTKITRFVSDTASFIQKHRYLSTSGINVIIYLRCSRVLFAVPTKGTYEWRERGLISSYKELRAWQKKVWSRTKTSLEKVAKTIYQEMGRPVPKGIISSIAKRGKYNFFYRMLKGKAIVLRPRLGTPYPTIRKWIRLLQDPRSPKRIERQYDKAVRQLLIYAGVGYD